MKVKLRNSTLRRAFQVTRNAGDRKLLRGRKEEITEHRFFQLEESCNKLSETGFQLSPGFISASTFGGYETDLRRHPLFTIMTLVPGQTTEAVHQTRTSVGAKFMRFFLMGHTFMNGTIQSLAFCTVGMVVKRRGFALGSMLMNRRCNWSRKAPTPKE